MDEKRRDLILHKRVRRIADEHGCSVAHVNAVLDHHPVETNRDEYLRRALAPELLHLDELEEAFRDKALVDRDVPSAMVLIKAAERRAMLLGLNPVLGHAVTIVQHPPANRQTITDKIEAALNALIEDGKRSRNGQGASPTRPKQVRAYLFPPRRMGATTVRKINLLPSVSPQSGENPQCLQRCALRRHALFRTVGPRRPPNAALRAREYLTADEIKRLINAARGGARANSSGWQIASVSSPYARLSGIGG